jgi:16S rRNA (uracil1498-N3)-methyltransferase
MHLFYTPDIGPDASTCFLNEEESRHCTTVLRLQAGDGVQLIDGSGGLFDATILNAHPKRTLLQIKRAQSAFNKRNHYLHIALAPPKNLERLEWFAEKATEIGIDEISLIICQRSERKEIKIERINKIITSAIKQSVKAYHPTLNAPLGFSRFLQQSFEGQKFIAHCEKTDKTTLRDQMINNGKYLVLIGPEGDFTTGEIDEALQNNFKPVTLGESRLRTETAALAACFEINFLNR